MNKNKIISVMIVGAAVTAGISLLFATEKGKSVVKKITDQKDALQQSTAGSIVNFLFSLIDKLTAEKNVASRIKGQVSNEEEVLA